MPAEAVAEDLPLRDPQLPSHSFEIVDDLLRTDLCTRRQRIGAQRAALVHTDQTHPPDERGLHIGLELERTDTGSAVNIQQRRRIARTAVVDPDASVANIDRAAILHRRYWTSGFANFGSRRARPQRNRQAGRCHRSEPRPTVDCGGSHEILSLLQYDARDGHCTVPPQPSIAPPQVPSPVCASPRIRGWNISMRDLLCCNAQCFS